MKIRFKLILGFVLVIVITASLYGIASYWAVTGPIQDFEQSYSTRYNWLIVNQLNSVLDHVLEDMARIPREDLIRFIQDPGHTTLHPGKDAYNLFHKEFIRNAIYQSSNGKSLYHLHDIGGKDLEDPDLELSILPAPRPTGSVLRISRRYSGADDSLEGRGFIFLDLDGLFHDLILMGPVEKTRVCLQDPSGTLLYATSDEPMERTLADQLPAPSSYASWRYAEGQNDPYYTTEVLDKQGNIAMIGFLIPALGAPLFVETDILGLQSLASSLSLNMLLIGAAIIWISVWIAMVLGYRIMKPVEVLSHGAERIASGEYDYRITYQSEDEIGLVARKFNEMADAVENHSLELERSNTALKEQDKQKTRFLDIVAHDLRTPLTSIKAYSDLLIRFPHEDDDTKKEFLEIILNESERMASLINDYLDLTKLENGILPYKFREIDLEEMIREFERTSQGECLQKKIRIRTEIRQPLPKVQADPDRLRQVFSNLLSNAIRYSPPGGEVTIEADRVVDGIPMDGQTDWIEVSVKDQGPGIPDAYRELVFDKFRQLDTQFLHSKGGAGLGLPISQEIIRKHSGTIWVAESSGSGAVFTFRVPVPPLRSPHP